MRVEGATISCGSCGEVVYPDCLVLANHTITLEADGRARWFSRDFNAVVHLCEPLGVANTASVDIHEALGTPVA